MGKREAALYTITMFSLIAISYIFFGAVTKIPNIANDKFMSLTGNVVFDLEDNYKVGDILKGDIVLNQGETDNKLYGMMLLTKDKNPLATKAFNLKNNSVKGVIKIEDLIDYRFEESGNYELLFSVLDLNINLKRRIIVE